MTKPKSKHQESSIVDVPKRDIGEKRTLQLYVAAGGRCEFDSCNKPLLRHHVTQADGNFAKKAHIVAFKESGPRGEDGPRPADINSLENLMLLCDACHHLVDFERPKDFPCEVLVGYKKNHEDMVWNLLELAPKNLVTALVFKTRIGRNVVSVRREDVIDAVNPAFPDRPQPLCIDLSDIQASGSALFDAAVETIKVHVSQLFQPGLGGKQIERISLFAIAPIPLLAYLGRTLGDKVPLDVYQRDIVTESWKWNNEVPKARFQYYQSSGGADHTKVVLLVSLSASVDVAVVPESLSSSPVYELRVVSQDPDRTVLRTREDLILFRGTYQRLLAELNERYRNLKEIHVLAAVPVSAAVYIGREPLGRASPPLFVYDYDRTEGYHSPLRIE